MDLVKLSINAGKEFGWDGLSGRALNLKEDFAGLSAAYFEVTGSHGRTKTTLSDRIYLVLEGEGEFDIDGEKSVVMKDDVIIVPKGTPYDYQARNGSTLKLYLVHSPAYDPAFDVSME